MEAIAWTALAATGGLGVFILAILKWIASIARHMAITETKAESADVMAAAAMAKCEVMGTDFHDHRVETGKQITRVETKIDGMAIAISASENRVAKAMEDLGERLDKFTDRLDRVLERGYLNDTGIPIR